MVQGTVTKTKKVGINRFEFSGKVIKKDLKFSPKGNMWGSIGIEIPGKEEKWKTKMFVKLFNEIAENAEAQVNEGDNYSFYGYIKNGSYTNEKTGEKKYTTDFVVVGFEKAEEVDFSQKQSTSAFHKSEDSSDSDVPF